MPFGRTNAPATFQQIMNTIFAPVLRKFVLVFVDDILVYSPTLEEHIEHLQHVFTILGQNQFLLKHSKCSFAKKSLEYLGHIISAEGVSIDPAKIQAVTSGIFGPLGILSKIHPTLWHYQQATDRLVEEK